METTTHIFRYWGTIEGNRALHGATPDIVKQAFKTEFGVKPFKIKMVGRKLTRFHTHRHFIAYFDATSNIRIKRQLDLVMAVGVQCFHENGALRHTFHRSQTVALPVCEFELTVDCTPLKALPNDLGEGMTYDVEAPVTASLTPRKAKRRQRQAQRITPPSVGTPAASPLEVR